MSSTIDFAYNAFCEEQFPLPSEEDVERLERRIGVAFPDDYREYLIKYNGGFFNEPDIEPSSDGCPADCLVMMRGIRATHPSAELAEEGDLRIFTDNDPPQIVPIGYTLMGNLIFLVTHRDGRGSIGLKKAWFDRSFFLANGIEEFFSLLSEPTSG